MPNTSLSADELQSRMRDLRRDLQSGVTRTAAAAKRLADWRHYVREFPWLTVGLAAAAGFMLVPRKRLPPLIDEAALAKMAAENRVVVIPDSSSLTNKKTVLGSLGGLLAAAATRAAMGYVSNQFAQRNGRGTEPTAPRARTPK